MRAVLYIITHLIFRLKLFRLLGTRFESKVLKRHLGPYGSITGRQREEALLRDRERKLYGETERGSFTERQREEALLRDRKEIKSTPLSSPL